MNMLDKTNMEVGCDWLYALYTCNGRYEHAPDTKVEIRFFPADLRRALSGSDATKNRTIAKLRELGFVRDGIPGRQFGDGQQAEDGFCIALPAILKRINEEKPKRKRRRTPSPLTKRQREVMGVVARHNGNTQAAADELGTSRQNVENLDKIARDKIAAITASNAKKPVAIDPATLDAGQDQTRRTKRQRQKVKDE